MGRTLPETEPLDGARQVPDPARLVDQRRPEQLAPDFLDCPRKSEKLTRESRGEDALLATSSVAPSKPRGWAAVRAVDMLLRLC